VRLLAFGGWGQLGTDLNEAAGRRGHELIRPRHGEVDVADASAVAAVTREARPDVVINAAAFHKTELCERDPMQAATVNAQGAMLAARRAQAAAARYVYVSTDYVFDGEREEGYGEDDPVAPVNTYGLTKAYGERLVKSACHDSLIVRGSAMFGHAGSAGKGGNFIETMLAKAAAGEPIVVVDDLIFAPTSTNDMAERLLELLERRAPAGIYHLANSGRCSWFGFARKIFELVGRDVEVGRRSAAEDGVRRPRFSVLLDTKTARLGMPPARHWAEAVAWYVHTRGQMADSRTY
jgi:dTDP-4-dehydrorhamnose reductase